MIILIRLRQAAPPRVRSCFPDPVRGAVMIEGGPRKGTNGVGTNWGRCKCHVFFDRGTFFGCSRQPTCILPKVPRLTVFPNLSKFITFAAAPLALTPFVRNQGPTHFSYIPTRGQAVRMRDAGVDYSGATLATSPTCDEEQFAKVRAHREQSRHNISAARSTRKLRVTLNFRRFLSTYGLAFRCLALIIGAFLVFGVLAMVGFQYFSALVFENVV